MYIGAVIFLFFTAPQHNNTDAVGPLMKEEHAIVQNRLDHFNQELNRLQVCKIGRFVVSLDFNKSRWSNLLPFPLTPQLIINIINMTLLILFFKVMCLSWFQGITKNIQH